MQAGGTTLVATHLVKSDPQQHDKENQSENSAVDDHNQTIKEDFTEAKDSPNDGEPFDEPTSQHNQISSMQREAGDGQNDTGSGEHRE